LDPDRDRTYRGPAGPIEYTLNLADATTLPGRQLEGSALVCHPHPLYGGTMHTRIVFHTAQVLMEQGLAVLRFNFRGVGASAGGYDHGRGEQEDVLAAMRWLREHHPGPVTLAGFSFGASMVARLVARLELAEVARAVLLGLPVGRARAEDPLPAVWTWQGPKIMLSGGSDEFAPVADLEAYFAALAEPKARRWIEGGDHFMAGHIAEFRQALTALLLSSAR
ncbi:MAG: alpha/beta hydrolase, partial [Terriglobales bacterium]